MIKRDFIQYPIKETRPSIYASVIIARIILFSFTSLLASLTVFTHIAQVWHLTFENYALYSVRIAFIVLFGSSIISKEWLSKVTVNDRGVLLFILAICVIGVSLSLFMHRPDTDDFYYVPNPVYYLQNPQVGMSFEIHFFYADGAPFVSHMTNTALPYEYIQAIIAYYTKTEYLFFYHILFPAIVGFLIPLSLFYSLSYFSDEPSKNAIGVLITIGIIMLLGETHRTIGNFSFVRAFHGKVLFLSVGIPLFAALSFDYFKKPCILSWLPLFIASISMLGATATACIMLPTLASILVITYLSTISRDNLKSSLRLLFWYFITLGYVLIYALIIRKYAISYAGIDSPQNEGFPITFMGHLNFFINRHIPITPWVAIISITASLIFCSKRKELFIWTLASFLLYLNPFSAHFLIENVTSPNIYWRMFYILPFPLTIAIAVSCALTHFNKFVKGKRLIALTLACVILLVVLHIPLKESSVLRAGNNVEIDWPRYKVPNNDLLLARKIIQIAPPGVMLAPTNLAGTVTMLSGQYPQLISRNEGIRAWLFYRNRSEEAQLRIKASNFVNGDNPQFDSFKKIVIMYPDLQSIVMVSTIWENSEVQDFLNKNKFTFHQEIDWNSSSHITVKGELVRVVASRTKLSLLSK